MAKICYIPKKFSKGTRLIIDAANFIISEYQAQGYKLTLRQLYYQFVARDLIANKQTEYKRLGGIISDGRLAGEIDWRAIEDRTRNLSALPHWSSPSEILESCASQFRLERWKAQHTRPEVWVEKEALAGVFAGVCAELDVPYFSCRGYVSQSEMWSAAQRLRGYERRGQDTVIFHFGDHDPSGLDMTRDIRDRLSLFGSHVEVERVALNMMQIEKYSPPPNPAKLTDARAEQYVQHYGYDSWELDALEPAVLTELVRTRVSSILDTEAWDEVADDEEASRQFLGSAAENWDRLVEFMQEDE